MSEFQYYKFHAIDNQLSAKDLASVSAMSSRVKLTPRNAIFTYSYSDFRYDPKEVLIKYFDFLLYTTNWGTKQMMMKFPQELVDYNFLKGYRISVLSEYAQDINIQKKSGFVVLDIDFSTEDTDGWVEENIGYNFLNIRKEIMDGDYQSLFIVWLKFLEDLYRSSDFEEDYSINSRLIPSNLSQLNSSAALVKEFYGASEDWLNAISTYSDKESKSAINLEELVEGLPKETMAKYLHKILNNEPNLKASLVKELKDYSGFKHKKTQSKWIALTEIASSVKATE